MNDCITEEIISYIEENRVSTTEIADCLGKSLGIAPVGVEPLNRGHFVVAQVKYLYAIGESNWNIHEEMGKNPASGKIIFMDAIDTDGRALVGDLVSKYFLLYLKNRAIVTNGKMRDAHRLIKENYPIWCAGVSPRGCFNEKPKDDCVDKYQEQIEENRKKYDGSIAICDDSGVVIIPKEEINKDFLLKLRKIEEQEDIWYDCIDHRKWSTFDTVCNKKYLSMSYEKNSEETLRNQIKKDTEIISLLNKWIALRNCHKSISVFLRRNNINKVAIYGMSVIGCNLYDDLIEHNIDVIYGIDRLVETTYTPLKIVRLEKIPVMERVDSIIVTATYYFEQIKEEINRISDIQVYSLSYILDDIL